MPTAQKVYAMLGNESLWEAASICHAALKRVDVPHAIVGGVAVCLHGYQRNTVDVDLLVNPHDSVTIKDTFAAIGLTWRPKEKEFVTSAGIPVQFFYAGDTAGAGSEVLLPDPAGTKNVVEREGLPVLSLAKLIESKLACGEGSLRRTHKDFADVVELIAANRLDGSFARFLHKSLRKTYRELARHAQS
jgi:hypothetical protein